MDLIMLFNEEVATKMVEFIFGDRTLGTMVHRQSGKVISSQNVLGLCDLFSKRQAVQLEVKESKSVKQSATKIGPLATITSLQGKVKHA